MREREKQTLPKGWIKANIGQLANYINGRCFKQSEWKKSGLPIVRIQNLNNHNAGYNYTDKEHEEKYRIKNDELLISWAASLGVYWWRNGEAWLNQHIFKVEPYKEAVDKKFLYFALKGVISELYKKTHGSGMVHITKGKFESHPLFLPPLNEQKRIVDKIEMLFSDLDNGEENLKAVQVLLKRYRQSVLKAAVTGELTKDWRKANQHRLEPGEALLKRILKTRREQWQGRGKYKEPQAADAANLPKLPTDWVWASPEQLSSYKSNSLCIGPFGSNLKVSDYRSSGVPLIFVRHIRSKQFEGLNSQFVDTEKAKELSSHKVLGGDLLITKMGDPPGDVCIYPNKMGEAIITADCIRFSPINKLLSVEYLELALSSRVAQQQIHRITKGVAQQKVTLANFKKIGLPLPSTEEQKEISNQVTNTFSQISTLENWCETELKRSATLRQSILKSAFSGKLVPQDPNDEPASELLKRIQMERTASKPTTRYGSKPRKEIL